MSSEPGEDKPKPATDESAQMGKLERAGALCVGGGALITGAVGVFVSDNQAGTAGLFVIAFAFLVIGIQGTPLIKFFVRRSEPRTGSKAVGAEAN